MADVVLIQLYFDGEGEPPNTLTDFQSTESTWAIHLGAVLENAGYTVKIIDTRLGRIRGEDESYLTIIRKEIENAICVGMSVMTANIEAAIEIGTYIKGIRPELPIVVGGAHPILLPRQTCEDQLIDFVIFGEGELTLLELVDALSKNKNNFEAIDGLVYKDNNHVKINRPRTPLDMNDLPFPAWHLLDPTILDKTPFVPVYPKNEKFRTLRIHSSRGCPNRCTFCINSITTNRWRTKKPERILDEMEFLVNKYKVELIEFREENFFASKRRVEQITEGIKKRKLEVRWGANIRADYFHDGYINKKFGAELKKCGWNFALIGAESGSNRVLNFLKKDITVNDILNSANVCNAIGVIPAYSFMIGLPTQTEDEIKDNIRIMKKIKRVCPSARLFKNQIFRPYPGGELYNMIKEQYGYKEPETFRDWINTSRSTQFAPVSSLTWIKNPNFVEYISENDWEIVFSIRETLKYSGLKYALYSPIPKFRYYTGFYRYPYERQFFTKFLSVIRKVKSFWAPN